MNRVGLLLVAGAFLLMVGCAGRGGVSISVSPSEVTLAPGATQEFAATVVGFRDPSVVWSATGGVLEASGSRAVYTAPDEVGEYKVTATSALDRGRWAEAEVAVVAGDEPTALEVVLPATAAWLGVGHELDLDVTRRGGTGEAVPDVEGVPSAIEFEWSETALSEDDTATLHLVVGPDAQVGTFDLRIELATATERSSAVFTLRVQDASRTVERYSPLEGELRELVLDNGVVTYEVLDGLALYQGDIVLGTEEELLARIESLAPQGNVLRQSLCWLVGCSLWPNGTVPYEIAANQWGGYQQVMEGNIEAAVDHWNERTPLRLVPREPTDQDYVRFVDGQGCSSFIGRQGGVQTITISLGCSTGNTVHEIGHAVGLYHEHTRSDRDNHVSILWSNIATGYEGNFRKSSFSRDEGNYDHGSIMHYGGFGFSGNGQATIETIPLGIAIGQRNALSDNDIDTVISLYDGEISNTAPAVASFTATPDSVTTGEVVTFAWSVTEPDRDPVTCRLDANGDGFTDYESAGEDCDGTNSQEHAYSAVGTYTATLEVDDGIGGTTIVATAVTVETVEISIDPTSVTLAPGATQSFTATVQNATDSSVTWIATCGTIDGTDSAITYTAPDSEGSCTLTATSVEDTSAQASAAINVSRRSAGPVVDDFAATPSSVILGQPVTFNGIVSDPDGDVLRCTLDPGDGSPAYVIDPCQDASLTQGHTYGTAGSYTAVLTATDPGGLSDSSTAGVRVDANGAPSTTLSANPTSLIEGGSTTFSFSAVDPDGDVLRCTLDPGDGSPAYVIDPCQDASLTQGHTYGTAGSYTAVLTATDPGGLSDSSTAGVRVDANGAPSTTLSANPTSLIEGGSTTFSFSAVDPDGDVLRCTLDPGDGSPAYVIDPCQDASLTQGHTYGTAGSYTAVLTATDPGGLSDSSTAGVRVDANGAPSTTLSANPTSLIEGGSTTFSFSAVDPDGDVLRCTLDPGDGSPAYVIDPCQDASLTQGHTYGTAGSYTAVLTATDPGGLSDSSTAGVRVDANGAPSTTLSANPTSLIEGGSTTFSFSAVDPDGDVLRCTLDPGDGSPAYVIDPCQDASLTQGHTYGTAGSYTAVLTATDPGGLSDSSTAGVRVDANGAPSTTLSANPTSLIEGGSTTFSFSAVDPDGDVLRCTLDPGDGSPAYVIDPCQDASLTQGHTYGTAGSYTAVLTATDPGGLSDSSSAPIAAFVAFAAVAAGDNHSVALDRLGTAWAWGANTWGQLGNGRLVASLVPTKVAMPAGTAFVSLSSRYRHNLALDSEGNVWAWGGNSDGQLGIGTLVTSPIPVKVNAPEDVAFVAVAAGGNYDILSDGPSHSLALAADGSVWAWGDNSHGQLGDGTTVDSSLPVPVALPDDVRAIQIAAGKQHSLALDDVGRAWAWGDGYDGQLGDGMRMQQSVPVQVSGQLGVSFVDAAGSFSYSIATDAMGDAWAWGWSASGGIGDGTTLQRTTPVRVSMPAGASFLEVAAGGNHSIAIDTDGRLWAWGNNFAGQLGDGTTSDRLTPAEVSKPQSVVFAAHSAGYAHSIAVDQSGQLWTWGVNGSGQLGDGTKSNRSTPVPVRLP